MRAHPSTLTRICNMGDEVKEIILQRSERFGFGFSIIGGSGSELPPVVCDIVENSPADHCQTVRWRSCCVWQLCFAQLMFLVFGGIGKEYLAWIMCYHSSELSHPTYLLIWNPHTVCVFTVCVFPKEAQL